MLCGGAATHGLRLNNGASLCASCFEALSLIHYPEEYERLRRAYVVDCESRSLARKALIGASRSRIVAEWLYVAVGISLLLCILNIAFTLLAASLLVAAVVASRMYAVLLENWDSHYPLPEKPLLRHFHDPLAELSENDQKLLVVFNHWPGYPPFWNYLREFVLERDSRRCQVTGCPSRLELHIHHKLSVSSGGQHVPNNLVSLCDFHHALEPANGHSRIWGRIRSRYSTLVRGHKRRNAAATGSHFVTTHLRRLELVSVEELERIANFHGFACPICRGELDITVDSNSNRVSCRCRECSSCVTGPQQLAEETGPKIAQMVTITKCPGCSGPRWDMLATRTDLNWSEWSGRNASEQRQEYRARLIDDRSKPTCPICGSEMRLVRPRLAVRWKAFWGCPKYWTNSCPGKLPYLER